jgi:hypothetical protein
VLTCYSFGTGVHTLSGAIRGEYLALGGVNSFLGYPTTDMALTPDLHGWYSNFEHGSIYSSNASGAHVIYGAIGAEWTQMGGVKSILGYPTSDEADVDGVAGARVTHFQGGDIYWSAGTGAHEVHGAIWGKYNDENGPASFLGLPTTDETGTPDGIGRFNHFQGGSIYWTPGTGAHSVDGAIRDEWASLGWERSLLGYPLTDEYVNSDGFAVSNFQNGSIVWRADVGTHLSFSRNELLNAINDAITISQNEGGIDQNTYQFLQECADDPNVYMTDANHNLLHKMIDGNTANAFYQGTPIGNLYVGAPAWKMYDLEQKWFEGTDLPYASSYHNTDAPYAYIQADGVLFADGGPSSLDVRQGDVGDCYLLASLEAVAIKHPDIIKSMITDNGDGTFTVRFFQSTNDQPGVADYITVDRELPVNGSGELVFAGDGRSAKLDPAVVPYSPLWVELIEKAYAQVNQEGWVAQDGTNSYNGLAGTVNKGKDTDGGINGGNGADALNQITNWYATNHGQGSLPWSGGDFADSVGNAYRNNLTIVVSTNLDSVSDGALASSHVYVLLGVSPDNQTFVVANPWGHDNQKDANGNYGPAITVLTRDQFISNFDGFSDA